MNESKKKSLLAKYRLYSPKASKKTLSEFVIIETFRYNLTLTIDKINKSNKIAKCILSCFTKEDLIKYFFHSNIPKKIRKQYENLNKHQIVDIIIKGMQMWRKF